MAKQLLIDIIIKDKKAKKAVDDVKKTLITFDKKIEKITKNVEKDFDGMFNPKKIIKKQKELTSVVNDETKKRLRAIDKASAMALKIVKGDKKKEIRIVKEASAKREHIIKESAKARVQIEKRAQKQIENIQAKGAKAGIGGKIAKGALALGGVAGAIAGATKALQFFKEAGEKASEVEERFAAIESLGVKNISLVGEQAKANAKKYGIAVEDLLDSVYFGFSAGTLKSEEDVGKFTEQIAKLSKSVKITSKEATQAVSSLVNQTGASFEEATDVIAQVMKEGVVKGGQELSRYVAQAAMSFKNLGLSVQEYGAAIAYATQKGMEMPHVVTGLRAIEKEFKSTAVLDKLKTAGVEGVDFVNRKVEDFSVLIQSLSTKGSNAVADIFGSEEAKRVLNLWAADSEGAFTKVIDNFNKGTGTMEGMYSKFVGTTQDQNSKMIARVDDIMIRFGEFWNRGSNVAKSALVSLFDFFEDDLTKASKALEEMKGLDILSDNLKDMSTNIDALSTNFEEISTALDLGQTDKALTLMSENLSQIQKDSPETAKKIEEMLNNPSSVTHEALKEINNELNAIDTKHVNDALKLMAENLPQIQAELPFTAEKIEEILNNPSKVTPETLKTINDELLVMNEIIEARSQQAAMEAMEASAEALGDAWSETKDDVMDTLYEISKSGRGDFLSAVLDMLALVSDVFDMGSMKIDVNSLNAVEGMISQITASRDMLIQKHKEGNELSEKELDFLSRAGKELIKLRNVKGQLVKVSQESVSNAIEALGLSEMDLELAKKMLLADESIQDITKGDVGLQKVILQELEKQWKVKNSAKQLEEDKINIAKQYGGLAKTALTTDEQSLQKARDKIEALRKQLLIMIEQRKINLAMLRTDLAGAQASGDTELAGQLTQQIVVESAGIGEMTAEVMVLKNELEKIGDVTKDNQKIQEESNKETKEIVYNVTELLDKREQGVELSKEEAEALKGYDDKLNAERANLDIQNEIHRIKAELSDIDTDSIKYQNILLDQENAKLELIIAQGGSELEILKQKQTIMGIEKKIIDLQKKQTKELKAQSKIEPPKQPTFEKVGGVESGTSATGKETKAIAKKYKVIIEGMKKEAFWKVQLKTWEETGIGLTEQNIDLIDKELKLKGNGLRDVIESVGLLKKYNKEGKLSAENSVIVIDLVRKQRDLVLDFKNKEKEANKKINKESKKHDRASLKNSTEKTKLGANIAEQELYINKLKARATIEYSRQNALIEEGGYVLKKNKKDQKSLKKTWQGTVKTLKSALNKLSDMKDKAKEFKTATQESSTSMANLRGNTKSTLDGEEKLLEKKKEGLLADAQSLIDQNEKNEIVKTDKELLEKRITDINEEIALQEVLIENAILKGESMEKIHELQLELIPLNTKLIDELEGQNKLQEGQKTQLSEINSLKNKGLQIEKDSNTELGEKRRKALEDGYTKLSNSLSLLQSKRDLLEAEGNSYSKIINNLDKQEKIIKEQLAYKKEMLSKDKTNKVLQKEVVELDKQLLDIDKQRSTENQKIFDSIVSIASQSKQVIGIMSNFAKIAKGTDEDFDTTGEKVKGIMGGLTEGLAMIPGWGQAAAGVLSVASAIGEEFGLFGDGLTDAQRDAANLKKALEATNKVLTAGGELLQWQNELLEYQLDLGLRQTENYEEQTKITTENTREIQKQMRLALVSQYVTEDMGGHYEAALQWMKEGTAIMTGYGTILTFTTKEAKQLYDQFSKVQHQSEDWILQEVNGLKAQKVLKGELSEQDEQYLKYLEMELDYRVAIQDNAESAIQQTIEGYDREIELGKDVEKNLRNKIHYLNGITESQTFQNMTLEEQQAIYDEIYDTVLKLSGENAAMGQQLYDDTMRQYEAKKANLELDLADLKVKQAIAKAAGEDTFWLDAFISHFEGLIDDTVDNMENLSTLQSTILENIQDEALMRLELEGYDKDSAEYRQAQVDFYEDMVKNATEYGLTEREILEYKLKIKDHNDESLKIAEKELEALEKKNEVIATSLNDQLKIIKLKLKLGKITEKEANDQQMALLLAEQLRIYSDINSTELEKLEIDEMIYDMEKKQTDEILDRNNARDKEMEKLVKKRNELLKQYRLTGKGGEDVRAIEMEIRARMQSQGIPEDEIEKVLSAFAKQKSFESGGWVDQTGSAYLHKGEFVLSNDMLKFLSDYKINMTAISPDSYNTMNGITREKSQNDYSKSSSLQNINIGNIGKNNYNIKGNSEHDIFNKIKNYIEINIPQIIVKSLEKEGLDLNKIRK